MEKNHESENFEERLKERKKRVKFTDILVDFSLLFIPAVLFAAVLLLSAVFSIIMLALVILILPMLYTVEKRLRFHLTGIGKPNYSYIDGYKEFYQRNNFGFFGILSVLSAGFLIGILVLIIVSLLSGPLTSAFGASDAMNQLVNLYMSDSATYADIASFLLNEGAVILKPVSLMFSITMLPAEFVAMFIFFNNNLANHYLATVVLPDIDKNMPSSAGRTLARNTFGRSYSKYRIQQRWLRNWPYYLAFILIHALLAALPIFINTTNSTLLAVLVFLPSAASVILLFFIDYFVLRNEYALIEETQNTLLLSLPSAIRVSVYQTYNNPNYIHGEESAARGCFVPAPSYEEQQSVYRNYPYMNPNWHQNQAGFRNPYQNPNPPQAPQEQTPVQEEPTTDNNGSDDEVKGGVVDFSQFADHSDDTSNGEETK